MPDESHDHVMLTDVVMIVKLDHRMPFGKEDPCVNRGFPGGVSVKTKTPRRGDRDVRDISTLTISMVL